MKVKNRERVLYYDILNILAIFSAVALHCGGIGNTFSTARWWKTSLIIEVVCYIRIFIFYTRYSKKVSLCYLYICCAWNDI